MPTLAIVALMLALTALPRAGSVARADDLPPGPVYVHFHACPGGLAVEDYDYLSSTCNEPAWYVNFYLTTEGTKYDGQWIGSDPRDEVFNNVPAHIFSLKGDISPYDGEPVVYCQGGDGSASGVYVRMQVFVGDGYSIQPKLGPVGYVVCDWFASASSPSNDNSGSVAVDVHLCPAGYNLPNADHNELPSACQDTKNGIPFEVASNNNGTEKQATGDAVDGGVYFQYLNPDFLQITAHEDGYQTPRVFCRGVLKSGSDYQTAEIPANGDTFAYNLISSEQLICDWYIAPGALGTLSINNHLCVGAGPDLGNADMNTLAQSCQQAMNGSPFTLKSANEDRLDATGMKADSAVNWQDVVPGQLTIGQVSVPGFKAPRVFCSTLDDGQGGSTDYAEQAVTDFAITIDLEAGASIACDWFNFTDGGDAQAGAIYLNTFACPAGFDVANATLKKTTKTCKEQQNGVFFHLVGLSSEWSEMSGDFQQGAAIWFGIPANEGLTLVAKPVDGYQTAAVYCGQALGFDGQPSGYDRIDTYDYNTIQPAVVSGSQAMCLWYSSPVDPNANAGAQNADAQQAQNNADTNGNGDNGQNSGDTANATNDSNSGENADNGETEQDSSGNGQNADQNANASGGGSVVVTVHICPVTIDAASASDDELAGNCGGDGNGFDFTLTTEGQSYPQMSGNSSDSQTTWNNVPAHIFTIAESIPGGYDAPIVICDGQRLDVSGGAVHPNVAEGATLSCDWYNVQA